MLKKTLAALSILLSLALAILGWLTYSAANAKPNISVNYAQEIMDLAREYQPESATQPNRRDEFVALLEDLQTIRSEFSARGADLQYILYPEPDTRSQKQIEFDRDTGRPTPEEKRIASEQYLEAVLASDILERTDSLTDIRHCVLSPPTNDSLAKTSINSDNPLSKALELVHLIKVQAPRLAQTDPHRAIELCENALAAARLVSCDPFTLDKLMANACELRTHSLIRELVTERHFSASLLDKLDDAIERQRQLPAEYMIRTERMVTDDIIQRTYSDNGKGNGYLLYSEIVNLSAEISDSGVQVPPNRMNVLGRLAPSRAQITLALDEIYDEAIAVANAPTRDAMLLARLVDEFDELSKRNILLPMLMPAIDRSVEHVALVAAERAATQTVIALERHRLETGRYPTSLDELDARLPADSLAPDGRLIYTPSDDGSSYSLYGVGRDRTDDGGDEDKDLLFVPVTP